MSRNHVIFVGLVLALALLWGSTGYAALAERGQDEVLSTVSQLADPAAGNSGCELVLTIQGGGTVQVQQALGSRPVYGDATETIVTECAERIRLTALSNEDWQFAGWIPTGGPTNLNQSIPVQGSTQITAVFQPTHTRTIAVTPFYDRNGELTSSLQLPPSSWGSTLGQPAQAEASRPTISLWYGDAPTLGVNGRSQNWVNLLGRVSDPDNDLIALQYSLNSGPLRSLSFGGDGSIAAGRRLARKGDFNIDLSPADLLNGQNQLTIIASDQVGQSSKPVTFTYNKTSEWPLPYAINWSSTADLTQAIDVVDGQWAVTNDGVRLALDNSIRQVGYDRVFAVGDINWTEYEVTVPITIHGFDSQGFAGVNSAPAIGLLTHWQGHTDTPIAGCQPKCGWLPIGMASWYEWNKDQSGDAAFSMWVHHNQKEQAVNSPVLVPGTTYNWKMRVEMPQGSNGIYRMKIWAMGSAEPVNWLMSKNGTADSLNNGSILFLAHYADVTFGNVVVQPLANSATATPTATAADGGCTLNPNNVLANPGFEEGLNPWTFYTNGRGDVSLAGPAIQCANAARLYFERTGSNMQLYQTGFLLKANTQYRLSFAAYSNTGNDLRLYLQRHSSPYTSYGISGETFNLSASWQQFSTEFTTSGFSGTTTDSRLRFWFVGKAANGDVYWIDNVQLEEVNGAAPTTTSTPASTSTNTPVATATSTSVPPTVTNTAVPAATNTPLPGATNTPVPPTATNTAVPSPTPDGSDCTLNPNNVLANPGFEDGLNPWTFYTNGRGDVSLAGPAIQCANAARLYFERTGSNMQLYQTGFLLKANTQYRLSFAAYSNTGNDLRLYLQRHSSPYTSYGISGETFNLSASWQQFSTEFTTSGFSGTTTDSRLRFWFVGKAANGDVYWIDNVQLEEVNGAAPTTTSTPASTSTNTPVPPTATGTSVSTATNTPVSTATNTAVPTATNTPPPGATNTPVPPTATQTATLTATNTAVPPTVTSTAVPSPTPGSGRVTTGLVALYTFEQGAGSSTVYDVSGSGAPLNLTIASGSSTAWLSGGGLAVNAPSRITSGSPASKIFNAVNSSGAVTVEAWIVPRNITQDGPARIVSLSDTPTNRNFTLGQGRWGTQPSSVYDFRLRTTATDDNGQPSVATATGTAQVRLQHIAVTFGSSGQRRLFVDGVEMASDTPGASLSNWDSSLPLLLANEADDSRPWLGDLHLVAFYGRALSPAEIAQNFAGGIHGMTPVSPTATPPPSATPVPTTTPNGPAPTATNTPVPGGGGNKELLVFDWNQPVTEANRGFPHDTPPIANGNWISPVNYAEGTLYFRVQIRSQPVAQNMKIQLCFWQEKNGNNFALETCGPQQSVRGTSGTVETWSVNVQDMWKLNNKPLEWDRPRYRNGAAIKNNAGLPVSNFNGWNWNGEDPKKWYPLDMRFTVVVVAKGGTFSGWDNYLNAVDN